jgi:outer membrane receptor for ferric coprogen and ferric-rhodotorulic acid
MNKIKRYKYFKDKEYFESDIHYKYSLIEYSLNDLSDIVEGTLAYLTDEGFVFSTETIFDAMQIFISMSPIQIPRLIGDNSRYKYKPFSWSSVKDYIIILFERLEKRFGKEWEIKVFLKIKYYYGNETEISYQEMFSFTSENIYGIRIYLS